MDLLEEFERIENLLDAVSSSEEEFDGDAERGRREYRMYQRKGVNDFDDKDFHRYFRVRKETFWYLHSLVGARIEGDRSR